MSDRKYCTVYVPEMESFIPIYKLEEDEIDELYKEVQSKLTGELLSLDSYAKYIVDKLIPKKVLTVFKKEISKNSECYDEIAIYRYLFDKATDVYSILSTINVPVLVNDIPDLSTEATVEERPSLTLDDFADIHSRITNNIIGQNEAVDVALKSLKVIAAGLESFTSMFFIGPTGVGKTELSREIACEFTGKDRFLKVNCGEYSSHHEYSKLIGSPPGYVGHDSDGILTEKANESSKWVILFDEIEKANDKLFDLLLSLLDEGKVTDNKGKELDFTDSIFLFTSNIGLHGNVGKVSIGFGGEESTYESSKGLIQEEFERRFKPEFINRIDNVVHFNMLTKEDASEITKRSLSKLPVKITKPLVKYIVDNSFSTTYGARNIQRFIKNNVTSKVADAVLTLNVTDITKLKLSPIIRKGELNFTSTLTAN